MPSDPFLTQILPGRNCGSNWVKQAQLIEFDPETNSIEEG